MRKYSNRVLRGKQLGTIVSRLIDKTPDYGKVPMIRVVWDNGNDTWEGAEDLSIKRLTVFQNKQLKKRTSLMQKYAKLCGYGCPPFKWTPMDYTAAGWNKLINQTKK